MTKGKCSNCCREADDLLKCTGGCGGVDVYCNRTCQKVDWAMHKKICPFVVPPLANGFPEAPVRAVRKMDGYGNSGVMLVWSGHLGAERLIRHARELYCNDKDDENKVRDVVEAMIGGDPCFLYELHVTSPVSPEVMKLKPGEACFNTEKYPEAVRALLENGIITDTGKRVKVGLYKEKFPVCRVHAPQTDNFKEVCEARKAREEMLASMCFETIRLSST
ncbi:hypothetical protein ACHAW5_002942 [Stephanodiscus triporus]|uniref:MYND-type domain-containing protein n=1 Tax=Stephanodiscus triporus TaxID=2934178 RepID=A0ABD3Q1Y0_9STRA